MKFKKRIKRRPDRPSLFKYPLFYFFIIILLLITALYQLKIKGVLRELEKKDLSTHLKSEGEELSHLLFHQFFVLSLKKENVKLILKKFEKDTVAWNMYQFEIQLPRTLSAQQVIDSLEKDIKSSFPDLAVQFQSLTNGNYQLIIKHNNFTVSALTFSPSTEAVPLVESKPSAKGTIALVIDDLGPNISLAREVLAIEFPITLSILPFYTYSKEIAKEAHSLGREVILHLPLEPRDIQDLRPEKGILYTWMDEDKILSQLHEDLSAIPYASGINGHMGSKFTEDRRCMEVVFKELKNKGLFFMDSLTTNKSVGPAVARSLGIHYGKRDIFIDRDLEDSTTEERLLHLAELSKKRGYAIGIAHPYRDTITMLKKMLPVLSSEGIELVYLSQLINHSAQKP